MGEDFGFKYRKITVHGTYNPFKYRFLWFFLPTVTFWSQKEYYQFSLIFLCFNLIFEWDKDNQFNEL